MSRATVVEHKQQFLRQQKQILAKGIAPSAKLLAIADRAGIQTKVLGDVMLKVNRDIKRHERLVHSRQMTDHVVEQIDLVYWEAGAPSLELDRTTSTEGGIEDGGTLCQSDDLTLDKHIAKLPATWDPSADPPVSINDHEDQVDSDAYVESVTRLQDLSAKRLLLKQKLSTYQTLLALLEPYRKPQENVQPNLIGKDAPLALELNKSRTLAIRLAGRINEKYGDVPVDDDYEDVEMHEDSGRVKLDRILESW